MKKLAPVIAAVLVAAIFGFTRKFKSPIESSTDSSDDDIDSVPEDSKPQTTDEEIILHANEKNFSKLQGILDNINKEAYPSVRTL